MSVRGWSSPIQTAATNPKVAQLLALEQAATGDIVVVSDSNVRVTPRYLDPLVASCPIRASPSFPTSSRARGSARSVQRWKISSSARSSRPESSPRLSSQAGSSRWASPWRSAASCSNVSAVSRASQIIFRMITCWPGHSQRPATRCACRSGPWTIGTSTVRSSARSSGTSAGPRSGASCNRQDSHSSQPSRRRDHHPVLFGAADGLVAARLSCRAVVLQTARRCSHHRTLRGTQLRWYWVPLEILRSYLCSSAGWVRTDPARELARSRVRAGARLRDRSCEPGLRHRGLAPVRSYGARMNTSRSSLPARTSSSMAKIAHLTDLHLLEDSYADRPFGPRARLSYLSFGRRLDPEERRTARSRRIGGSASKKRRPPPHHRRSHGGWPSRAVRSAGRAPERVAHPGRTHHPRARQPRCVYRRRRFRRSAEWAAQALCGHELDWFAAALAQRDDRSGVDGLPPIALALRGSDRAVRARDTCQPSQETRGLRTSRCYLRSIIRPDDS